MPRNSSLALIALAVLVGCTNLATLQEPETMPEGDMELSVGGTFTGYALETTVTETDASGATVETTETEDYAVPALLVSGRIGVRERLEVHGNVWLPLGLSVGGKYMLLGDRQQGGFAFSPGLDLSMPVGVTVNDDSFLLFDASVPLHMGYRASPDFALYWTPKYVLRLWGGDVGHVAGGNLGIGLGNETQFLIEGGAYYDTLAEDMILTGGLAVAFR
jgi:hypothetical protein